MTSSVTFVGFNQDASSLSVGTSSGYKLFTLTSVSNLEPLFSCDLKASLCDEVRIVERLFSSSLLALVTKSSPRKLKVCHFKKGTEICNYKYTSSILSVRLNRCRLVVCLEDQLIIHNIRDMKIIHTIKETPVNPLGLCALSLNGSSDHTPSYLAYPGSSVSGEVQLFDALNLHSKRIISAHDTCLAAITFDASGKRLATASERGTIIRVFNLEDGLKVAELRRGVKRCANIQSLAFSTDDKFIILSSNTQTIHVFRCHEDNHYRQQQEEEQGDGAHHSHATKSHFGRKDEGGWMGYLSKAVTSTAHYLPSGMTESLSQTRSFATITLSSALPNSAVAMTVISKQMRILIATTDGYLYIYNLPGGEGGECVLVKQHRIDPDCSKPVFEDSPKSSPIGIGKPDASDDDDEFEPASPSTDDRDYVVGPAVLPVSHHQSHSSSSNSPTTNTTNTQDSPPPISHVSET